MSTVKNFSFTIHRKGTCRVIHHDTTARTLAEAQADLRHFLRVHHPEILDEVESWGYRCEVSHV